MTAQVLHSGCKELCPEWVIPIEMEMELIEKRLESAAASDVDDAFDVSMHLISAGGKRIRPALTVLSALAVNAGADKDKMIDIASASELVHTASLVHDDVIDETSERRGVETANSAWGNKLSVLVGDYLLSKAFSMVVANDNIEVMHILTTMAIKMTESEILQASGEGDLQCWEDNYWRIISDKTANFMSACCECGAIVADADDAKRRLLADYGSCLGRAFQIVDDILDIAGNSASTGKAVGTDLSHGKFTLPVLLALRNLDESKRQALRNLLDNGVLTREQTHEAVRLVRDSGAVALARQTAAGYADKACEAVADFPPSPYKNALISLAAFIVNRDA